MNYEEFENKILSEIKNNDNQCLDTIKNNKKLISIYLNDNEKQTKTKDFVNKLNDIILIIEKKNLNLIEKVLYHELFASVLEEFRNSDVLLRGCKEGKNLVVEWLLSMKVSTFVQDDDGRTALMYAVKSKKFESLLDKFLTDESIYLTDKNNENVLFHAATNLESFNKLILSLNDTVKLDLNHKNNNGETVFIYCCKHDIISAVNILLKKSSVDLNARDNDDRNGFMYLVDHGRYMQLYLLKKNNDRLDCNYRNKNQETLVSHLIQQFRRIYNFTYNHKTALIKRTKVICYAHTLMSLNEAGCDFNAPIDEDGNTPLMFFIMVGDKCSVYYIVSNVKNLDLSIKNRFGQSATSLSLGISEPKKYIKKLFYLHKTFDYDYVDLHNNTLLNYFIIKGDNYDLQSCIYNIRKRMREKEEEKKKEKEKSSIINPFTQINDKNENPIIIAVKLGRSKCLEKDFFVENSVNQQDDLGNTALFYAIKLKDRYAINLLRYYHADPNIKNKQGVSPIDLSIEMNDESIKELLKESPLLPEKFEKKDNKGGKFSFFDSFKKEFKEKEKDEKLNNYIQNYQINNYREGYDFIFKSPEIEKDSNLKHIYLKENLWLLYSKQYSFGSSSLQHIDYLLLDDDCEIFDKNNINDQHSFFKIPLDSTGNYVCRDVFKLFDDFYTFNIDPNEPIEYCPF